MQDITKSINNAITAHTVMHKQAGNRMIVSFQINRGDYSTNQTSHYGDIPEIINEWDKLISRYGENNVTMSSVHGDAITKYINDNK